MKKNMRNGWDKLKCGYFAKCARLAFDGLLKNEGFGSAEESTSGGVTFRKLDVFLDVSYLVETSPRYSLTVVLGIGGTVYDKLGQLNGVPLWYLAQPGFNQSPALWSFSSEEELGRNLLLIRDEILMADRHLFSSSDGRLVSLIRCFKTEHCRANSIS